MRILFVMAFIFFAVKFFQQPDPIPLQAPGDSLQEVVGSQRDAGLIIKYDGLVKRPYVNRNTEIKFGFKRYKIYRPNGSGTELARYDVDQLNEEDLVLYFYFDHTDHFVVASKYRIP
jgi:hypothetical protein